jgi:hypothetical protein
VIEVEGSLPLIIPIRAARPGPDLSLPEVVHMGAVLVGTRKTLQIPIRNAGGLSTLTVRRDVDHNPGTSEVGKHVPFETVSLVTCFGCTIV